MTNRSHWAALLAFGAMGLATSCADTDTTETDEDEDGRPTQALVDEFDDGSLRREYLGGWFVTRNREMPVEIEQAIQGFAPDRPVIVWAGR